MASSLSQTTRYICRACRRQRQSPFVGQSVRPAARYLKGEKGKSISCMQIRGVSARSAPDARRPIDVKSTLKTAQTSSPATRRKSTPLEPSQLLSAVDTSNSSRLLQNLRNEVNAIAASDEIPEQSKVLEVLEQSYNLANLLVFGHTRSPEEVAEEAQIESGDIPLLSDLQEDVNETQNATTNSDGLSARHKEKAAAQACELIYNLLKDAKVALDEDILAIYVRTICQLGHPQFLPEIFFLYANKPLPIPNTKPIQYRDPSTGSAKNAVPQQLSDVALDTAILQRDLPLAIAIIDTTVATPAFRRNKFLRKGSIPLAAVGSTPLVAWAGAEWLAQWQDTFDPAMSKYMTMMGAMAYIGTLGTVGFIALTTWNDHHDRVVWTPGTPLRQRWSREEERLYFDRLAVAWGFQKKQRRGEEMGEEWEALRGILGERSMILDKTDLLEGMQ